MLNIRAGAAMPNFYTKRQIMDHFGWTRKMTSDFLPCQPDLIMDYPIPFPDGRKELYKLQTVISAMQRKGFFEAYAKVTKNRFQRELEKHLKLVRQQIPQICQSYMAKPVFAGDTAWAEQVEELTCPLGRRLSNSWI